MRTYYIEDSNGEILNYTQTLSDAKQLLQCMLGAYGANDLRIVCLSGPYKYEGVHLYYLKFNPTKNKYYYSKGGAE